VVVLWNGEIHSWNMREKEGRGGKHSMCKEIGYDGDMGRILSFRCYISMKLIVDYHNYRGCK